MKGILFKPESIQAIIEGRKTQTRRLIKPQPEVDNDGNWKWKGYIWIRSISGVDNVIARHARYHIGETVYIKETFWFREGNPDAVIFKDGTEKFKGGHTIENFANVDRLKFRSPMFLKAEYARYFIVIEQVRAERVQEITAQDAIKEGVIALYETTGAGYMWCNNAEIKSYKALWNTINPKYPWESNPWVFVYTFTLKV